jgi:DNA-binding NtrC family response regulator
VALVKQGADDYVQKPWDDAQLLKRVKHLMLTREQQLAPSGRPLASARLCGLLFRSAPMHSVVSLALKVASTELPALITGPNGSGKEKIAEIIQANSARHDAPFIRVNVGALPDELFAAELFGAEAGAYTGAKARRLGRFEAADGGTLFLDEIGNLSMESQAKLLRAVQSGEFERLGSNQTLRANVRIVAATNVSMVEAIAAQKFREDLYYRLAVIELVVPPLCERVEDIMPLAEQFANSHSGGASIAFSPQCVAALEGHTWPGNVRELQNRVQRALLLAEGGTLTPSHFGLDESNAGRPASGVPPAPATSPKADESEIDRVEREAIEHALAEADHVVKHAAQKLGLTRQALYRRMQRLGIKVKREVSS